MGPKIRLLITDLDNTLYDWVTYFAQSFYAMVDVAVPLLGVDREQLLDELKAVHQRHHNSEHPYALLETPAVAERLPGQSKQERKRALAPAFEAFDEARAGSLRAYPGVHIALRTVMASGCKIAAHTEATAVNAASRLRRLDLAPLIPRLYATSPPSSEHPEGEYVGSLALWGDRVRFLAEHERKPDIGVVHDICRDHGVDPEDTLYVGDSLARDVGMAKAANAHAAWAKYGLDYDKRNWARLVRVTHWTDDDVKRAEDAHRLYGHIKPDAVLNNFHCILDNFAFS